MKKEKYQQIALVMATALLMPASNPTIAQAPAAEITPVVTAEQKALQNPKKDAKEQFAKYNWSNDQFACLSKLWGKESGWNHLADNPNSTAFGVAQMLGEDSLLISVQIDRGLRYLEHRYGSPCVGWRFWQQNKWY